jgi:polyhydroxyalkanoate synthesis regulator phasin
VAVRDPSAPANQNDERRQMSNDDDSRNQGRSRSGLGQGLPSFATLSEVFGAAVDGASRMTRTRAKQLAERLLSQAGLENVDLGEAASEAGARINQLTEEILAARKANRALLQRTITNELEKSLQRLGLARAEDLQQLRDEVTRLRTEVAGLRSGAPADVTVASTPTSTDPTSTARTSTPPRKAPAQKTATGPTAKKAPVRSSATKKTPAKSPAAKKTTGGTARKTASSRNTGGPQA